MVLGKIACLYELGPSGSVESQVDWFVCLDPL